MTNVLSELNAESLPLAMIMPCSLVGAGLGEDLDASVTELVEFRGEWVLVDSYFADGGLGRELPAGKSVDVDLASVGAGRRPGERVQLILQLIGIVRERVQVFALDHDRARVVIRAGIEARTLIRHCDLLLIYGDDEGKVLQHSAPWVQRNTLGLGEGQVQVP